VKNRVRFAVLCAAFLSVAPAKAEERRSLPNVVFFLADDVGYGDVGIYGGVVPTPNIDRLARDGMRFTDAHSPAALCAPSRFSLLTGSNPYRNGRPGGQLGHQLQLGIHDRSGAPGRRAASHRR
jgi:arylsulfatase A-like enzyme